MAAQVSTRCSRTLLKTSPQANPEQAEQPRGASKPEGRTSRHVGEKCGLTEDRAQRMVGEAEDCVKTQLRHLKSPFGFAPVFVFDYADARRAGETQR